MIIGTLQCFISLDSNLNVFSKDENRSSLASFVWPVEGDKVVPIASSDFGVFRYLCPLPQAKRIKLETRGFHLLKMHFNSSPVI